MTGTRPAAVLARQFDHASVFLVRHGGGFARGSAGDQRVRSGCDLSLDQRNERLFVHFPVTKGGNAGGMDPLNSMATDFPGSDWRDNHFMKRFGKRLLLGVAPIGLLVACDGQSSCASLKPPPPVSSPGSPPPTSPPPPRLDSADAGEWGQVRSLQGRISDPAAQALVRWRIATNGNAGMGFGELMQAAEEFKGWPGSA